MLPPPHSISAVTESLPTVYFSLLTLSFPRRKQVRCKLCHFNPFEFFDTHWERSAADQQQGDHRFKDGGQHVAAKQNPSRGAVSSTKNQAKCPLAIKAMAAKLAHLVYRILRYGMKYVDQGSAVYEAQHRQAQIKYLKWKAAKLGYQILPAPAA